MTSAKLIRWSGMALAVGAIAFLLYSLVVSSIGGIRGGAQAVLTTTWVIGQSLHFVGATLILFGVLGLYSRQMEKSGALGLVGFIVAFLGIALDVSAGWVQAYILPTVVANQPSFIDRAGPWFSAPSILAAFALHDLSGAIGYILLGIATVRAGVLPRWAAVLVIIGAVPYGIPVFLLPEIVKPIGNAVLAAGLAWLGYALGSGKGMMVMQPQAVR